MTPAELDALEALANGATAGPWDWRWKSAELFRRGADGLFSDMVLKADRDAYLMETDDWGHGWAKEADAEFIAAARQDVPALIAEVRRLRELVSEAAEELDDSNKPGTANYFRKAITTSKED